MTRVTQLIHDAGKYLLISVYPLPTHPTHNFTHNNGGNLETLPGWPKKLQHNRPASAGQSNRSGGGNGTPILLIYLLWPTDTIWRQRSRSTLAQVMACCLAASNHYFSQCFSSNMFSCMIAISQEMLINLIRNMCSEISLLKPLSHLPQSAWYGSFLGPQQMCRKISPT